MDLKHKQDEFKKSQGQRSIVWDFFFCLAQVSVEVLAENACDGE